MLSNTKLPCPPMALWLCQPCHSLNLWNSFSIVSYFLSICHTQRNYLWPLHWLQNSWTAIAHSIYLILMVFWLNTYILKNVIYIYLNKEEYNTTVRTRKIMFVGYLNQDVVTLLEHWWLKWQITLTSPPGLVNVIQRLIRLKSTTKVVKVLPNLFYYT